MNGSETLPIFAWRFDGSDALVWSNQAWREFARLGVAATFAPEWWNDAIHPNDIAAVGTALAECRRTRAATERSIRIRAAGRTDDVYRRILWRFSPSDDGPGIIALGIDVRDAQRVDLRLDRNVDELRRNDLLAIAETIPVMVWRTDPQGFSNYFNARWYEYTGLTPEQSFGTGWTTPIHPADLLRTEAAWYDSIHHGVPYDLEFRLRGADGSYRWFIVRGRPLRSLDGSVASWFGTCTDIDAQKTAVEALATAKMRAEFLAGAETILERSFAAPHLIADLARHAVDAFATICFYDTAEENGELTRLAAVHRDPDVQRSWDVTPPGIAPWRIARLAHTVGESGRARLSTVLDDAWLSQVAGDAEHAEWIRSLRMNSAISVPIVTRGRRFGVMSFGRTPEVTPFDEQDQRVAEELGRRAAASLEHARLYALARDNERRAAAIADTVPQIFWTAHRDGYVDWYNRGWYEYTGQTPEAAVGWGWQAATHPHDFAEVMRRWSASIASGEPFEMSFRLRGSDGAYRWFLTRMVPERDERSFVVRWYGSNTNVDSERRATLQLALFAELGDRLAALHTPDATLDAVVESLVPSFGDLALIEVVVGGGMRLAAIEHRDAAARRRLRTLVGRVDRTPLVGAARDALARRRTALVSEVGTRTPVPITSAIASPLLIDGEVRGVLTIGFVDDAGSFADADLPFVEEIARRIAPALVRAELFERERRIAETFQAAVLPRRLPQVAGLQFDALYEPGRAEAQVGGDWYDAFRLLDGRVVISIGDVVGNGLAAATAMAEVRQSIRGAAAINPDPALLLDAADRTVQANEEGRYATAWVGIVDPIDLSLRYASAGHPPPFVREPDGTIGTLFADGLPLGLADTLAQRRVSRATFLAPGSIAVLYTDGLIENERDAIAAEARLATALADAPAGTATASGLREAVLGSATAHDDIAILVAAFDHRLADVGAGGRVRRWSFDVAGAGAATDARREVREALRACGLSKEVAGAGEVIAGELLGNVQRYAAGRVDVILDLTAEIPVLHVIDHGPGFTYSAPGPADAFAENGRGLYIVGELSREFSVTRSRGGGTHARAVLETRGNPLSVLPHRIAVF